MVLNKLYALTFTAVLVSAAFAQAQTFTTLYNFAGGSDGGYPYASVIQDPAGNLYGTTYERGDLNCNEGYGCGAVYEVNTAGTETVLHSFAGYPSDGAHPYAPVIRDSKGNIYGTTFYGGSADDGTVFKIDTAGNETVLYSFTFGSDGCEPVQGLVVDEAGDLYGTTPYCGASGKGAVFKVTKAGKESILHNFAGGSSDGAFPFDGHLTLDKAGNLYGLAEEGGSTNCSGYGCGVLYKLSKKGTFTVLYSFAGGTSDGCYPLGTPTLDSKGNFYGTTADCGANSFGTVWTVSNKGKETILHNFGGGDGCWPSAGVARGSNGGLYSNTLNCGTTGYGTVWELSAKGRLTVLHSFGYTDGAYPLGEVLRTAKGTLFGTTSFGGAYDFYGTVWSYVP